MYLSKADRDWSSFSHTSRYIDGVSEDAYIAHLKSLARSSDHPTFWYGTPPGWYQRPKNAWISKLRKIAQEKEQMKKNRLENHWNKTLASSMK